MLLAWLGLTHTTTPGSLQGEYRAGGRAHTPSRVAPPVGRHQLNPPQGSSTFSSSKTRVAVSS